MSPMKRGRNRTGGLTFEMTIALLILLMLLGAIAKLLIVSGRQQKHVERQLLLIQEAANAMERAMALAWDETTAERVSRIELTEVGGSYLTEGRLSIAVSDTDDPVPAKRLHVRVDASDSVRQPVAPAQFTAWKFPAPRKLADAEASP